MEYMHPHQNARMGIGPDGRPVPEIPMGPGVAPTLSSSHASRHGPPAHELSRQLPPISQMAPVQHLEPTRSHGHSHSPHISAHANSHSRSHSSSSRSRTHQSSVPYPHQHPAEVQSPVQHINSPSISGERERSRRHEGHERAHGDHYSHSRHQLPVPPIPIHSPPGTRNSTRSHHQHRIDRPSLNHNELDRERELELDREWEYEQRQIAREREMAAHSHRPPTPPFGHRSSRQPIERPGEYHETSSYRIREEQAYHRDAAVPGGHTRLSRSGTPGSGSGSGVGDGPQRPDSRTQFYDRERTRSYAPRQPPHDDNYIREGRRAHSRDRERSGAFVSSDRTYHESRKRSHYEMEMDGEIEVPPAAGGGTSRKRIHQDNTPVRDADSQEEDDNPEA
jgi:hypothetical protein